MDVLIAGVPGPLLALVAPHNRKRTAGVVALAVAGAAYMQHQQQQREKRRRRQAARTGRGRAPAAAAARLSAQRLGLRAGGQAGVGVAIDRPGQAVQRLQASDA